MTFDPDRVARVWKPRFIYQYLTHSGLANGYKYTESRILESQKTYLKHIKTLTTAPKSFPAENRGECYHR